MQVAVIQYNAGNVFSVIHALRRAGVEPLLTDSPEAILSADKVIFPGVGEASTTMAYLRRTGLDEVIRSVRAPLLGICIGLQLLCRSSEEGDADCLGVFPVAVRRFRPADALRHKVPHMGWNTLSSITPSPLFEGISTSDFVYYVHSFYAETSPYTLATTDYILPYSAALARDNFYAVQFHPEKSGEVGTRILRNFLEHC